ncbi:hypothetical protein [Salmonirosea aquatica]|uniref:Uncharacterized protein n=1 Tax=Salmonirosea aquatica TaxID=2654236 RepID=A0A7C9F6J4_9BACT|nr:hypothetical protein [Cytophagaceae bacterium SJW1-29]
MNPSENPKFEQEWQRMFESASETPPLSAWEAIEKHLDEKEAVVIPLVWWKNPKVLYAAAAVVALLLVSWPVLRNSPDSGALENRGEVATRSAPATDSAPAGIGNDKYLPSEQRADASEPEGGLPKGTPSSDRVATSERKRNELAETTVALEAERSASESNRLGIVKPITPALTPDPLSGESTPRPLPRKRILS